MKKRGLCFLLLLSALIVPSAVHPFQNIFGFQDDRLEHMKHFPLMAEMGVKWVRTYLFWSDVEPVREDPPRFHWGKYDEHFKQLLGMGLTPIVIIAGNPGWMATYPGGPFDKGDKKDYLRFVEALVERYDGDGKEDGPGSLRIRYWEIYNEPDLTSPQYAVFPVWGFWGNEPVKYAELLKAVYPVMKRANPEVRIVFGGLALDNWAHFNSKFLEEVLKAGAGHSFDIMNFHFYHPFHRVWDRFGPDIVGKANYVKSQLASHGLQKEIFCTEGGHWSGNGSTSEFQAAYLVKLFTRAMAADLKAVIWFVLVDHEKKGTDFTRGLLDTELNKKPAFHALRHLISILKGSIYKRPMILTDGADIRIEFEWKDKLMYKMAPHEIFEGYHFYRPDLKQEMSILWTQKKELEVKIFGRSTRIFDHYGKRLDETLTNRNPISIRVGQTPVFIEKGM